MITFIVKLEKTKISYSAVHYIDIHIMVHMNLPAKPPPDRIVPLLSEYSTMSSIISVNVILAVAWKMICIVALTETFSCILDVIGSPGLQKQNHT